MAIDPAKVRLSEHFLLSDFIGNHSVYTKGYANIFEDADGGKLAEARCLAANVLEPIVTESPLSVSYGYISFKLAQRIITYQSPNKPSYHQWNDGAAADVIVHSHDNENTAPIEVARACDEEFPVSRVITYSESPYICVATRRREVEAGQPRRAFYENRYEGKPKAKPKFCKVWDDREAYFDKHRLLAPWRGCGYPTYHGGGIRQVQHIRVGRYCMLSDFLYSTRATQEGFKNCPTLCEKTINRFRVAGDVYSKLLETAGVNRLSIIRAYESPAWSDDMRYHWKDSFRFDVVVPSSANWAQIGDIAHFIEGVHSVSGIANRRVLSIGGYL